MIEPNSMAGEELVEGFTNATSTRGIQKWASLLQILRRALRTYVIGTTTHSGVLDLPLLTLNYTL